MNTPISRPLWAASLLATSALALMGCNKASDTPPASAAPAITVGTQVDDAVITAGVKSALMTDSAINSFDLQVETRKGTVLLSGFVDSQAQIDQALSVARGVSGVVAVDNSVTLKGPASTVGTKIDDASVTGRVKTALLADPGIKSLDISVLTVKGVVQLTGFVNNQGQIDQATQIARADEGASGVKNELKIKQ